MSLRQSPLDKGSEKTFSDRKKVGLQMPGGLTTPRSRPPNNPVTDDTLTRVTSKAPRSETKGLEVENSSEVNTSQLEWRPSVKNPHSKLRKTTKTGTLPRLPSLQMEIMRAEHREEEKASRMGEPGVNKLLSRTSRGSVTSEDGVPQRGTPRSGGRKTVSEPSELSMPIRSLRRSVSEYGGTASLKDEETVQQSLLLSREKGKNRQGSQQPLSDSDNGSVVVPLNAE
jgi:hypothetical protein